LKRAAVFRYLSKYLIKANNSSQAAADTPQSNKLWGLRTANSTLPIAYFYKMNLLFKALNDQTRREILTLLKEGDKTAGEIADHFNISKPSISHHLDLLKQAGLVEAEKQGQFISYSLNTTVVDEIAQWFIQFKTKRK
jgi:DNA-binding transcriptional ArsR family regulator